MATKKRKKVKDFHTQKIFKGANLNPDYAKLFEALSPSQFVDLIFLTPILPRYISKRWKISYEKKVKDFYRIFNYHHKDDIYQYLKINHSFNKDKTKRKYVESLIGCIHEILETTPTDFFLPLEDNLLAPPIYVYGHIYSSDVEPYSQVFANDVFEGYGIRDLKAKYNFYTHQVKEKLKEIYQQNISPIDISLVSYN